MSRFSYAVKSFINYKNLNEDFERPFMTILSNIVFGKKSIKKVLKEGFSENTYVYSIINRISESAADIPIIIENKNSKGETEEVLSGDFYNFVHRPNTQDNYKTQVYKSLVYQLATGNTILLGIKGVGGNHFSESWNLAPQYITPRVKNTIVGPQATSYKYNYSGKEYDLDVDEVMHLVKFNPDPASENPVMGLSPLQAAYRTLVASNEIITADASLIKNKGAIGLLTPKGGQGRPVTPNEAKAVDKALKDRIGGGKNYGSIKTTTGSFDFIKFAMSPQDLQILESGVMKLRDLCSIYGVSSRMFNDPNGTTFNNSKEDGKKFYTQGVLPPLENYIDQFNRFFVPSWNERDNANYTIRLDVSGIEALQEDQAKEIIKSRTRSEIVTRILTGISEKKWTKESAILQLMDALGMDEEKAISIVGETPEQITETNPIQNGN